MKSSSIDAFAAVFWNEVLLNTKRVAPYLLMVLFGAHAVLWWVKGPAVQFGWATNSDFNIARNLGGFSFLLGLPIFNAVIMGDPVIRDFRLGVVPLIFSKPISNASYLLGKFLGNAFVLVCCQAVFPLTLLLLQLVPKSQMIVQPFKVVPYFKHFFILVVISHLFLAAIYFTVGTLTRNVKIVYAVAVGFYPVYSIHQAVLLKGLPNRWRTLLDPMGFNDFGLRFPGGGFLHRAEFLNQVVIQYSSDGFVNRAVVLLLTAVCLTVLYLRFSITERAAKTETFSTLNLSTARELVSVEPVNFLSPPEKQLAVAAVEETARANIQLPNVTRVNHGLNGSMQKLLAAVGVELHLLRNERSLIVLLPLTLALSVLEVAFYQVVPEGGSYSAAYASNTAGFLLLFLLGVTIFYTGEAMHRDRELRIEPVLWATPAQNHVLLLSKFVTIVLLAVSLMAAVGVTAVVLQFLRGHRPVEIFPFLKVYLVILFPGVVFTTSIAVALNVMLRDKYVAYAILVGASAALFYLYSLGYNDWLYNPMLYKLWQYADLTGTGKNQELIFVQRVYWLAIAVGSLSLAHLFFPRHSTHGATILARLRGARWPIIIAVLSILVAVIMALIIRTMR